jgi:tetratricopeptide (TPR) repeat protein
VLTPGPRRLAALVVAVALASHITALADGFVFDDTAAITTNPLVQEPSPWRGLVHSDFWGRSGATGVGTWRPLVTLSFWVDQHLGGGGPFAFHCSNLLFHTLAALALALALMRATRRPVLGALAAALFAVLAVDGEAVASLVGRADVMAALFCFLCWYWWRAHLTLATLAFIGALLCKESAIVWPLVLAALEQALPVDDVPRSGRARWWPYLALAAAAALYLAARHAAVGGVTTAHISSNNNPLVEASLPVRLWTSLKLLILTLRLMLLPLNSSADYSAAEIMPARHFAWEPLAGALALALLVVAAVRLRATRPALAAAARLFLLTWLPISNALVPLPTIFAERLLYLPAAAVALAIATLLSLAWPARRYLAFTVAAILVAGNLALDVAADRMWHDDLSLFAATVQVAPRSARAWINYGAALQKAGQREAAVAAYTRSLVVFPTWKGETSLGVALDELGQPRAAEPHLRRAVAVAPTETEAAHNLALFLARHGGYAEAAAVLRPMLAVHPEAGIDRQLLEQLERTLNR